MTKEYSYNIKARPDTSVSYNLYDKNGMIISEHPGRICFSDVSYELIPAEADHLTFWTDKSVIPYNFETCKRWTEHINWCGFPCSIAEVKNRIVWTFKLSDFKYKKVTFVKFFFLHKSLKTVLNSYFTFLSLSFSYCLNGAAI